MQDISKSFGGVTATCVCDFCEFFQISLEHSKGIFQGSLTFIYPVLSHLLSTSNFQVAAIEITM